MNVLGFVLGFLFALYLHMVVLTTIRFKMYDLKAVHKIAYFITPIFIMKRSLSAGIAAKRDNHKNRNDTINVAFGALYGLKMYFVAVNISARMLAIHYKQLNEYGHSYLELSPEDANSMSENEENIGAMSAAPRLARDNDYALA